MRSSARGLTTATLALATALSVSVAGPHRAYAAPGATASQADNNLAITVLSPTPRTSFTGNKPIEVSAFYQGSDNNQISSLELYVDGVNAYTKRLDAPEDRGVISFLIDTSQLTAGAHAVVVRAVATDAEVVSAKTSFLYVVEQQPTEAQPVPQIDTSAAPSTTTENGLPELSYITPSADAQVQGTVRISLKASEPDGKSPYVSLFIDRTFKTLRNYAPYEYDWDTTAYTNGYHTIEAYGYDQNQNVGPAQIVRVYVNNPGGRTEVRKDLKDGIPAKPSPKSPSKYTPYMPSSSNEAKAIHKPVPTVPIADAPALAGTDESTDTQPVRRTSTLKPLQTAKLNAISDRLDSGVTLSDPFVTTSGAPVGLKALGPARRPSARLMMLAKRMDVLDETGGLHSGSDLSDPFIPGAATAKPSTNSAQTPTTGFKPMPSTANASSGPALATAMQSQSTVRTTPSLITRDAHTIPQVSAPVVVQPALDLVVKAAALDVAPVAKTVKVQTPIAAPKIVKVQAPVAGPKTVKVVRTPALHTPRLIDVETPVVKAKTIAVHTPAASKIATHRVEVHTPAASAELVRARGEMKVYFNHTSLMLDRPITPRAGVMFSPLRQIFEFQGGSLTWQPKTGEVHAQNDEKNIYLHIGDKKATVNDQSKMLEMAPYLDGGRTMVPLSFLPMALDVNVKFDPTSGHLLITTKQ